MTHTKNYRLVSAMFFCGAVACATTPTGRRQLALLPDDQLRDMGRQAFEQLSAKQPIETDKQINRYVACVTQAIVDAVDSSEAERQWEVRVFKDETPNAFALPGGKIGVHTGMLRVADTPAQLAAVLGHEVGHVLSHHGNERMSQQVVAQVGLAAASAAIGAESQFHDVAMAALGVGTQVGVLLPFSRKQESEADVVGLRLMAKAGFDPAASVELWRQMEKQSTASQAPPEFLSTHPSHGSRIDELHARLDEVMPLYQNAGHLGQRPKCQAAPAGH